MISAGLGNDMEAASVPDIEALRAAVALHSGRAKPLYDLADGLAAVGEDAECAAVFRKAYLLNPAQRPALSRDPNIPQSLRAEKLRRYAQTLIDHGVTYTAVIAALGVAESLLGNREAVERLYDHHRFLSCQAVAPPAPFSAETFHASLAEACVAKLRYYDDSSKVAFQQGWRNVDLMASQAPAFRAFEHEMRRHVERYIAALPDDAQHPFIAARPRRFAIDSWAVVSNADSHHLPHIHPRAWLTGVYYVERPEASRKPGTDRGWLKLTPPRELADAGQDWLTHKFAPEPGSLVLVPGYFLHGTQPLGADQRRICIAFDVRPTELQVKLAHPNGY